MVKKTFFYNVVNLLGDSQMSASEISETMLKDVEEKKMATMSKKIKTGMTRTSKLNYITLGEDDKYSVTEEGRKYVENIDNPIVPEKKVRVTKEKKKREPRVATKSRETVSRTTKVVKPRAKTAKPVVSKTRATKAEKTKVVKPKAKATKTTRKTKEVKVRKERVQIKTNFTKYEKSIFEAILELNKRGGSSVVAISNKIRQLHNVVSPNPKFRKQINNSIKKSVEKGLLKQKDRSFSLSPAIKRYIKNEKIKFGSKYDFGLPKAIKVPKSPKATKKTKMAEITENSEVAE